MASLNELKKKYLKEENLEGNKGSSGNTSSGDTSRSPLNKLKDKYITPTIDQNGVNDWLKSTYSFVSRLQNSTESEYKTYKNPETAKEAQALKEASNEVKKYIRYNKIKLSNYDELYNGYTQLSSALDSVLEANKVYSQFKSDDDFYVAKYSSMSVEELKKYIEEEYQKLPKDKYGEIEGLAFMDYRNAHTFITSDGAEISVWDILEQKENGGWLVDGAETNEETVAQRQAKYNSNKERIAEINKELDELGWTWWFTDDQDKKKYLKEEKEALEAENNQYDRTQGKMDKYYTPVTEEFTQNAAYRDYSNASREDLLKYNSEFTKINDIIMNGGYFDENGNVVNAYDRIEYAASNITKAYADGAGSIDGFFNSLVEDKLGMFLAASQEERDEANEILSARNGTTGDTWATLIQEGNSGNWELLSEYEVNIYYNLYKTQGKAAAYQYLDDMTTELNRRATQERAENIQNASIPEQILLNVVSVPMNVFGGAIALLGDAGDAIAGKEYNPYSGAHSLINDASVIRQDTAQDIDTATGNLAIPWLDFSLGDAYQGVMSGVDSAAAAIATGGSSIGAAALLSTGAAASEMQNLYERGASSKQILAGGILAGAAEMVFEKFSIDSLVKMGDSKSISAVIINALKQGGVEASEEMLTEVANTISDVIIMGSQSEWVNTETFIKNVVNAGLGGFISGGGMGGVVSTANKVGYDQQVKKYGQSIIESNGVNALQDTASQMSDNKTIKRLSDKVANKATAKRVGKLATTIQNITDSKDRANIIAELESQGLSKKEAQKVADFTIKISQGYEASEQEIADIEKITDKLPDAADTSTDIDAEEYSRLLSELDAEDANATTATEPAEIPSPASQDFAQQTETVDLTENPSTEKNAAEGKIEASESVPESDTEGETVTLADASVKYGAQAQAMIHTYAEGQNVAQYDKAYETAYNMGKSGVSLSYALESEATAYLSENQRKLAYEAGKAAADTAAKEQDAANKKAANGKTGRKIGAVKGEGVTIEDLKKTFNDTQNKAYKILSTYAEATGIDIVLYKSEANADGKFEGAQGRFKWSEDAIYIDINAGLADIKNVNDLAKYAMLRTFSHEFTHFIEKWNPIWYNEFRKVVFDTLTERGENVHDLIEQKMALTEGMSYDAASREVVAEAMTDILPDANFVQELAENHKNIFQKILEKLKEFAADLKAYFDSIGHNRSREANALKEQVGEAVRYVDNIVKLFDKVALEAVENYQMTVATETEINNNTDGGINNAEQRAEQTERTETVHAGRDSTDESSPRRAQSEDENRSRVQETVGEKNGNLQEDNSVRRQHRGLNDNSWLLDQNNYISPAQGSDLHKAQSTLTDEYGIESHIVKKSAWNRKASATTYNGKVYISEGINSDDLRAVPHHEATHAIKQRGFKPYLEFIELTPDMLNMKSQEYQDLMDMVADHLGYDVFSMNDKQRTRFYDELNAIVYGWTVSGLIYDEKFDIQWIPNAFNDFDAYINELTAIHEQYKKENAPKKAAETVSETTDNAIIEEREKEFKKKFSSWFKKAGRKYVLHYGGAAFISDGAFGLRASEDMINMARLEFSGQIYETDAPTQAANALDKADMRLTEAPIEGTLGEKTVYAFDIDGKKYMFDKKLLSRLDGNLLYIGDFAKGMKIIKAVDTDGNTVGFLLPVKAGPGQDVTNTKPSKLKSFSNKFLSQINQEVNTNGENADNQGTVSQPSVPDRQGDTRLLDESETRDVSGDAPRGDSVGDSVERGRETRRDDNNSDAAGTRGRSSEGNSESGDIRRDDVIAEESAQAAEKLHEEVTEQIVQQSTEKPKGRNFVIGDSLDLPNGEKARYKANVEAIRLVKQLEAEKRYATEAEQAILSKYVGWGGIANAFDERKSEWAKEYKELKDLLTKEEYELARGSTLNAHYTDISVIKAMYDGLRQLGFNGGRVLEPASGVGNFVGAMPTDMSAKVKSFTMVELDGITGLIAKYLYPNADVRIQGFEKANIPNNFMDVAISNVPFGNYPITDKAYPKKVTSAIHNYFFAKSLDKVRPGGILMFITSSYTMNAKDETVRRYIMSKADLLGAIRLPDTAFKGNAGTEVVTDILILKKREAGTTYAGEDFLEAPWTYPVKGNYNGANINSYFAAHPEMVLGTPSMEGGMYRGSSLTYKAFTDKGSLADQIREAFKSIKGKMDYPKQISPDRTNFAVEKATKKTKQNGFVAKDGKIYQNQNGELIEQTVSDKVAERIKGMLEIRDAARDLQNYQQEGLKESEIKKARTKLNKLYDEFVKKNGYINSPANKSAILGDPDRYSLFALENYNPDTKKATKADIFSKNTIAPNRTVTSAKDVSDGLIVSVNQTGGVDVSLIAKLTGKTEADVTRELIDSRKVFKNRNGELETAETYLSGNVRAKLRDAEALVPMDKDFEKNVEALKAVVPEDVPYGEIFVNPGTPWIPNSVYSDFAAYMLGTVNREWRQAIDITRNPDTGNFTVDLKERYLKSNAANTQKWGTSRRTFLELFDAMLNSKSVVVKDKLDDGSYVINKDATAAANEKIENIQKEFSEWLWKDEARREELATLYNETFNSIVTPKYNGDNLTVNGANAMKPLRPHQRNAVQRVISSGGNTLLAHKVGAGKTYEMAAAAMKLKQLGLVRKPMFAVPKSLVAQWGNEFIDFFPTAKLLVAEASDFTAANRKTFMNRIANGDYDAVIVSYEQFEKLPMSDDFTRELYQEQIDSIVAAIEEAKAEKGAKAMSVKDLEKKRKSLQAKIDKLTDKAKDEDNIDFEQLGVDSLFIDEAHNFKNLFYTTSMTNVSGLGNKDGSKRAFDLYTKVRYLQKLNGGRGIVFATATPVMNSMSEMYIMQKYLQPDLLQQLGLSTFDAWAKQFGEVVNGVEIKPSGQGYRVKQSFSRFKNMSELQLLFRNFADVLTDIPGLKIPKMKGGKVNVVVCEPGQFQQDFMKELEKRADNIKNVDPSVDNMLKITSDGRKISYTQRMIEPTLPYEEGCKIYRCADNVIKGYNDSKDIKGTQLIFCDMATPKGKSKTDTTTETDDADMDMESAKLYDDIRARLIEGGIPRKEIAFIHEADTDQKKKKLFADVNDGKVRVLIGSTGKMGVGMNAQKRVVAIHHLDAPWRPGDVEQRNGRAFRQGNINEEVECFTYVTEGSFDARLWDILERKQNFINQVMNGESVGREAEDTGEVTLSAAEVKALASGSPLIMEQVQLDTDIKKLESLYRAHRSAVVNAKDRLIKDKGHIASLQKQIENGTTDMLATRDTYSEGKFSITIGKQTFTEKKDAGTALMAAAISKAKETEWTTVGNFAGFEVRVVKSAEGVKGLISGKQGYAFNTYPNNTTFMINHMISVVESITERVNMWRAELAETEKDMAEQEKLINEPFAKQSELDAKRARYAEVMEILNPKEEQQLDGAEEDTVQEQSREYLNEQEQQRTDTLTDREVLAMAAEEVKVSDLTEAESDALQIFKDRLSRLNLLEEQRAEQGRLYKEQQFGTKPNRAEAEKTLNRMHVLDDQIKKATADMLSVEDKEVLKRVLKKARRVVEVKEREHGQEILNRWRDRRNNAAAIKKYRDRLRGDVDELTNWIIGPKNKDIVKHVPDVLKNSVIPFLGSINFMSKRALKGGNATVSDKEFIKRLNALKSAIKTNIDVSGMYSGYNDLPPNFMESLQRFIDTAQALVEKSAGEFIINQMTSDELRELSKIVRTLKKYIMQVNRFHNNAMYQHVYEAGDNSIEFLKELDNAGSRTGAVSNFVLWQQIRPAYAFERFGKGGEAIYDGLRQGQAKLAFNTEEIKRFTEKAYTAKEVKAWEEEIKTFTLGNDLVKMPVSYIMSFYELSKDPEAKVHIDGEGIRVATYTHKGKKISDTGHILTVGEFNQIIGSLTDRQREVADSLQKYMATQGGKWGNYVSVARFGEELFTNPKYFPINSDGRHLSSTAEEHPSAAALYALLNMSFTKSRKEGANNRIVIYSIFDVFANHMASMAQYNAMALPVLDALKWFNYQQVFIDDEGNKTVLASVREQMTRAYGVPEETRPGSGKQGYAETFIVNIIKAFNGTEAQGTPYDSLGLKSMRRYNMAQVAYNLRVVVQQPMAITRAGMLLDYRSIIKGMKLSPSKIKQNIEEMQKYSGIAAWKALGFYDVNISRGLAHIIKHDSRALDKIGDVGMWGAEKADLLTWAGIWSAAKEEVTKKQHLTPESEGFYEAVTKLFDDVIYKTQVVDSILTKNEFMRDKGTFARLVGSFMSEPVTNASMLIDAYDKYHLDMQRGMSRRDAWQKNSKMIGRRLYVYGVGAVLLAAVQAAADALRDDDEYEEYGEKWLEAFIGNFIDELMPFNKLPIISDFYDLAKELLSIFGVDTYGNPPQSVFMQWYDSLIKGVEIISDKIMNEDTNYTWYGGIYKLLQAASGITGLPMASATREIITAWNNTVGAFVPSLKLTTYESSELSEIRYAYEDGYLTYDEAVDLLLEKELADNENEAHFIIQGWEAGEGYSRYDAIFDAVRNGGDFDSAMDELTSHGYTEEEVISKVKSKIGEWYRDGEVSKQQAINMLTKYTDMTNEEITSIVNKWSSKVVTGIDYEDIDDEFSEGKITASRAIEMYMLYGGMTREKATEKVTVLEFVKQHPSLEGISYSAVEGYTTYCEPYGVTAETFYDVWKYNSEASADVDANGKAISGSKKAKVLNYINSLSLSVRQKDSLYLAFGWAESKLYEAPWR